LEQVFYVLIGGFFVLAVMLYALLDAVGDLRNDVNEATKHLKSIGSDLGWNGTIHKQLIDIEKAIKRSD
jgi:hypothetical protein